MSFSCGNPRRITINITTFQDPPNPLTLSKSLTKLQGVVNECNPRVILLSPEINRLRLASKLNLLSSARHLWPDLPYQTRASSKNGRARGDGKESGASSGWFGFAGDGANAGGVPTGRRFDEESLEEDDVAFLQFTSGSTSEPKGVMVTFGNLMHNVLFISQTCEKVRDGFLWLRGGVFMVCPVENRAYQ